MKQILLVGALLISIATVAQAEERMSSNGPHSVSGTMGFNTGGFTLSGEYEYMMDSSFGVGAYIREFPKDTDVKHSSNGYLMVGGNVDAHFYKKNWDLSFAPGFAVIKIDSSSALKDDTTTMGPSLSVGLLWQLTPAFAVGFENARYWVWFSSDYAGQLRDDMSIKGRFSF